MSPGKKEKKPALIEPISPSDSKIAGVIVVERKIFADPRGALIETYSPQVEKERSVYAYWSATHKGEARDPNQYHHHKHQKDRFTVVRGRMWILLFDMREDSPTFGKLEVLEMKGANLTVREKSQTPVYTLTIPEGVYHAIMAPGPGEAELVNHPTRPYNPSDEGRVPFQEVNVPGIGFFSWELVQK